MAPSVPGVWAQAAKYPPLNEYLMSADAEIALAKSAAPANISDRATIKVLTTSGYQVAHEGENGFTCMVMRGLPKRDEISFAYMWSADHLGPGISHWHPHMMVFAPYYENSMLGGNGFGVPLPIVTDDGGTPFAVVVIPVDDKLAVKAQGK